MTATILKFPKLTLHSRKREFRGLAVTPHRTINRHDVWCSFFHDEPMFYFDHEATR